MAAEGKYDQRNHSWMNLPSQQNKNKGNVKNQKVYAVQNVQHEKEKKLSASGWK